MSVKSTLARLSARAAASPPNPPPMITTRGRTSLSGKSLLEGSGGERHKQHQKYQQNTVRRRCSECQSTQLRKNLYRDRTVGVSVENDARHELTNRGHGSEQSSGNEARPGRRENDASHRHQPGRTESARGVLERGIHLSKRRFYR